MAKTFLDLLTQYGPVLALLLQAFLLSRFLDGRNRNYPLAILYSLLLFVLTTLAILWQNGVSWIVQALPNASIVQFQSALEILMHLVLLILMLQLIRQTQAERGEASHNTLLIGGIAILTFATTMYWVRSSPPVIQFNRVRQVMSFFMVLLNLYWWTLLLGSKKVSRRILLLSTGIGLQMTGQVIGDGILSFLKRPDQFLIIIAGLLVIFLTHFCSLAAWYEAFHPKNAPQPSPQLNVALPKFRG